MSELVDLRDRVDAELHRLRTEREIRPPVITCYKCGTTARAAEPSVSVRAMILSLGRFGVVETDVMKALERRWKAHRRDNRLDLDGRQLSESDDRHVH